MVKYHNILKKRNFSLLLIAQNLTLLGDKLCQFLLIAIVYQRSPNSSFALAKLFAFTILPIFFIGPIAGIYNDLFERKSLLFSSNLLRGLILLLAPFVIFSSSSIPLYILVFILFSLARFFLTAKLSLLPDLVSEEELLSANTIISTSSAIVTSIGVGISGYLIDSLGIKFNLWINAIIYFIASLVIFFIVLEVKNKKISRRMLNLKNTFLGIKEGFKFIFNNKEIAFVMRIFSLLVAISGGVYVTTIVLIQQSFGTATKDLGSLGMILGIGFLVSAFSYGKLGQNLNKNKSLLISIFVSGLLLMLFTFSLKFYPRFYLAGIICFCLGFAIAPSAILATTILQEKLPSDFRGRTFGALEIFVYFATLISMALIGLIADLVSRFFISILLAFTMMTLALWELRKK